MKLLILMKTRRNRQSAAATLAAALLMPLGWAVDAPHHGGEPDTPHTIEALVAEALIQNPELHFYESEIAAAMAARRAAGAVANPELSGSVGQKRLSSPGLTDEGVAWSIALIQPFEWPGRIGLRKSLANHDIELARLGLERFKSALAGRVKTLAYGLFAAQEKSAAAAEVAERFRSLREVLVQRDPAGLTPLLETRVIEATELNAQRKATNAELATQAALMELNLLRGIPPDTYLSVAPTELEFRPAEDTGALLARARTNNFELRLRTAELAQQGLRVDLARNERYPTLAVGPEFSEENVGDDREQIIGVGISLPLPLWNSNRGHIDAAIARRLQAEVSLTLTERDIQRKVIEAAVTYETKRREMTKWRPDSVQHFREAAALADRHYRLGAVPISTYVELQQQYLEAVDGLLDTRKETLEAAIHLELLTGLSSPLAHTAPTRKQP